LEKKSSTDVAVNHQQVLMDEVKELPAEVFPNLLQIVHLFKESIGANRQAAMTLLDELSQWDLLSDEALGEFEKELS